MHTLRLRAAETPLGQAPPGVPYRYDNDTIPMAHPIAESNPTFELSSEKVPGPKAQKKHAYFLGMIWANRVRFLQKACFFLIAKRNGNEKRRIQGVA
jgi:hypothetical protein